MLSDDPTSAQDKPTRRAAAKKATYLAVEKLKSSPSRSEDERGLPSFGEPSLPKTHVKVTYAGKKLKSPAKGSSSFKLPLHTPPKRAATLTGSSSRKQRTRPATARDQEVRAKAKPLTSAKTSSTHAHSYISRTGTRTTPKTPSRSIDTNLSHKKPLPVDTRPRPKTNRKRGRSPPTSEQESESEAESILTPLSSDGDEPSHPYAMNGHRPSSFASMAQQSKADQHLAVKDGDLVWVRLDMSGGVSEDVDAIWWPCKVTSADLLEIALFGQGPAPVKQNMSNISISTLPHRVLLPMLAGPRKLRFDEKTCTARPIYEHLASSPRKRHKSTPIDIIERWKEARDEMLQAYEDANDGFPLLLSLYKGSSPSKPATQSTARPHRSTTPIESEDDMLFTDPGPSMMWDIPGELVLAKDNRKTSQYWPAKVMRYLGRENSSDKEKYEVLYFDKTSKIITRDMILSTYDDEFKTCQMGDSRDNYALDGEPPNPNDEDATPLPDEDSDEEKLQAATPPPALPTSAVDFIQLSVEAQFEYTKSVLSALLNGKYLPSRDLHVAFMKGGKLRNQVTASAWKRGDVSHKDKEVLSTCIRRWMIKREKRQALSILPQDEQVEILDHDRATIIDNQEDAVSNRDGQNGVSPVPPSASQSSSLSIERAPSSAAEEPPSSFVEGTVVEDDNMSTDLDDHKDPIGGADPGRNENGMISHQDHASPSREHVEADVPLQTFSARKLPTYAMLSDLDKITYCTSVLLPEAILQLLLWRNGLRDTPELLSPAREEHLHRKAARLASATYWVHDIVLLKRAAGRSMLPQDQNDPGVVYSTSGRAKRKTRHT